MSCVSCVKWHSPNLNLNISFFLTICVSRLPKPVSSYAPLEIPLPLPYPSAYPYPYMLMQSSSNYVCVCVNVCTAFVCARQLLEIYLHAFNWHSSGGDQRLPPPAGLPGCRAANLATYLANWLTSLARLLSFFFCWPVAAVVVAIINNFISCLLS